MGEREGAEKIESQKGVKELNREKRDEEQNRKEKEVRLAHTLMFLVVTVHVH